MTTPATETLTTSQLEALAVERTKIDEHLAQLGERKAEIDAQLRAALDVGTHDAGPYKVQVRAGARRLNTTRFEAAFPVTQNPQFYKPRLDTAAVREHIAPSQLADFYDVGKPVVTIK